MKVQLTTAALAICALASRYGSPYLLTTYECKWDGKKCAYYVEFHYVNAYGERYFYPDSYHDDNCPVIQMFSSPAPAKKREPRG
ncbi:hypothetical protein QEV83_11135 [Methylocapsa sp. D3K7]|uniref:hypothetical protein n=1 Tax=Methylocapsa sp. D3K7 TaxID=3041435 RepID=UPI00244ED27F|nr:hypothetical protein [Methylocapsa sp. D3K7]WGJ13266.1 hypothetical protein QEV83_11135 [Methylocapsa sp. D3K7]